MTGIGTFSFLGPGYSLPIEKRLQLIKDAGFDAVSLWWAGNDKQPDMARKIGLQIDNIHTPFDNCNQLWFDSIDGEEYQNILISCVEDCYNHDISTAVIHLAHGKDTPVSELGLKRVGKIVDAAEQKNIKLAFENITATEHLDAVFERFSSPYVGFCYDSGHENCNHPDCDCLTLYGDRLFALHIHDNYGDGDCHMLPFDGTIDWPAKMQKIKQCKDVDFLSLEACLIPEYEQSAIYKDLSAGEYLETAYKRAIELLNM